MLCSHFCQAIVKIFEYKGNNDYVFATTNNGDEQMDDPINPGPKIKNQKLVKSTAKEFYTDYMMKIGNMPSAL